MLQFTSEIWEEVRNVGFDGRNLHIELLPQITHSRTGKFTIPISVVSVIIILASCDLQLSISFVFETQCEHRSALPVVFDFDGSFMVAHQIINFYITNQSGK